MPGTGNTRVVLAKTSAFTVLPEHEGALFTNRGAGGSVTFTMPTATAIPAGWWCEFYVAAAQAIVVSATSIISAAGSLTNSSITTTAAAAVIGTKILVVFDGTTYLATVDSAQATTATSVASYTIA